MAKLNKKFSMGVGKYYFNIKTGQQSITITRKSKQDAINTFLGYVNIGKDCEWLGCWNGKKFDETTPPAKAA